MALEEFWNNVAKATRVRQPYVHTPDAARITHAEILHALAKNSVWCQKRTVQGFTKDDWRFLGEEKANRLEKLVQDFLQIVDLRHADPKPYTSRLFQLLDAEDFLNRRADELSSTQNASAADPLSREQIERILERLEEFAQQIFASILEGFEFHRFGDAEAFRIGKQIEDRIAPQRPAELAELRFETGPDSTDDPALWVWAFVADGEEYDETRFLQHTDEIESVLEPIAREAAPEGRLYLRFRSTVDQPEAEGIPA